MIFHLEDSAGQPLELDVPTTLNRVTVRQFVSLQGKDLAGRLEVLTGVTLPPDTVLPLEAIAAALEFLKTDPEYTGKPYPQNIGALSIGQAELAKKVITETAENGHLEFIPFLYAIYMLPDRINPLLSFVQGFPQEVAESVRDMPICEVYGAALHFYRAIGELVAKYAHAIHRAPEPEQEAANVARFAAFGFFGSLAMLATPKLMQEVLSMPAEVYYMQKVVEAVQMDFNKDYQQVMEAKNKS